MSKDRKMDYKNMIYTYNGMILILQKEETPTVCDIMNLRQVFPGMGIPLSMAFWSTH